MKIIADFHIHSRFSRATSKELCPEEIDYWARVKGLQIVGTGDFTHPDWRRELMEKLEQAEYGLYQLKEKYRIKNRMLPPDSEMMRFMFSAEISCIYKKAGAIRKLHHLILTPSLESSEAISKKLSRIGNLKSDGRPILGLDSKDLLELILEADASAILIPAHIWTPWFSLFGSMSGFDSIEECFEEFSDKIFALETGLSSDPAMNWRLSALDRFTLVSNSDAHSVKNLAREACIFDCKMDYNSLMTALKNPEQGYLGTIEFFPEEGKYHYDGHRKCGIRFSPKETRKHNGLCPKCAKPLTIGVMNRVEALADRDAPKKPENAAGYKSLIPLAEVLGEILRTGPQSKSVEQEYLRLTQKLGPELKILLEIPIPDIQKQSPALAIAIERMRKGEVRVEPGYDGEYGIITVFAPEELEPLARGQDGFFQAPKKEKEKKEKIEPKIHAPETFSFQHTREAMPGQIQLDALQKQAIESKSLRLLIKAGPGTGKTWTLTRRIAHLIETGDAKPEQVLAITFTNQASEEMRERLQKLIGERSECITIRTIHSFAYQLLKEFSAEPEKVSIIDEPARMALLQEIAEQMKKECPELAPKFSLKKISELISRTKNYLITPDQLSAIGDSAKALKEIYTRYQARLNSENCLDFDDIIFNAVKILSKQENAEKVRNQLRFIFVDEYQDIDFAQYHLIKLLTGEKTALCVIGDPDQSIYSFRGASPEFFLRFTQDFPDAETIELKKSFRSSDTILLASSQALSKPEPLCHSGIKGPKLKIIELPTERAEAEFVAHEIEKLVGGVGFFSFDSQRVFADSEPEQLSFSDIAVLFRASVQIPPLIQAFSRLGIPYRILAESPLKSKFFRICLWTLQILSKPSTPFLIRLALSEIFPEQKFFPENQPAFKDWLIQKSDSPKAKALLNLIQESSDMPAPEIMERIFSLIDANDDEIAEKEMVKELVLDLVKIRSKQKPIGSLAEILEMLRLASPQDFYDPRADKVSVLTIHSAKGLEFDAVFIVGLEEGIIPHISARTEKEIREEARILYVAMTRAKKFLYLSRAKKRVRLGKTSKQSESRFLKRIEQNLLLPLHTELKPLKPESKQLGLFEK